jgi:hypothetical protein
LRDDRTPSSVPERASSSSESRVERKALSKCSRIVDSHSSRPVAWQVQEAVVGRVRAGRREMDRAVPELERERAAAHVDLDGLEKRAVLLGGEELRPVGDVIAGAKEPGNLTQEVESSGAPGKAPATTAA